MMLALATQAIFGIVLMCGGAIAMVVPAILSRLRASPTKPQPRDDSPAWPSDASASEEAMRYVEAMNAVHCSDEHFREAVVAGQSPADFMRTLLARKDDRPAITHADKPAKGGAK